MPAVAAQAMGGPTLLHVGERSPKDKNYETSEVVLAPPGTVVAPIPKGVEPTTENAIALILGQLMKHAKENGPAPETPKPGKKIKGMAFGGPLGQGGILPPSGGSSAGPIGAGPSAFPMVAGFAPSGPVVAPVLDAGFGIAPAAPSTSRPTASGGGGSFGSFGTMGYATPVYDPGGFLSTTGTFAGNALNYDLGLQQLDLGRDRLKLDSRIADQNYQLGQGQLSVARKELEIKEAQLALAEKDLALKEMLGLGNLEVERERVAVLREQVAAQRYAADLQYKLGVQGLALGERERQDALALGTRQLDLQAMDDEFNRIMRGVSEASVAGLRSGRVPTQGLL